MSRFPRFSGVRAHDANRVWRIVQINGLIETIEMGRIEGNLRQSLRSGDEVATLAQGYLYVSSAIPAIQGNDEQMYRQRVSSLLAIAALCLDGGSADLFSEYSSKAMEHIANRGDYFLHDLLAPLLDELDPIDETELTIMGPLDLE